VQVTTSFAVVDIDPDLNMVPLPSSLRALSNKVGEVRGY
jgi:hypothetical protein